MIESFQQQQQMSVLELYVEKDVAGGSMFHAANYVTSCGRNVSHHESELPRNISNLHDDEDDDDDDYLASNSYVEESFNEDDSDDGISDTDDEVTDIVEPVSIVHPTEGVPQIQNPFWNDAMHYNNINWSHPDEEDILVWTCQRLLILAHDIAVKGSLWAMKIELVFSQNHRTIAGLQKYQCHDPEKDTDTFVSDTQQMFVACNTFHGHAPPFVGNILPLQQCPFFCLSPEFQYLTEACETVVREIDALMRNHVTLAQ
ncbi:hypothetical protein HKD37_08G023280 [Glycine soja]